MTKIKFHPDQKQAIYEAGSAWAKLDPVPGQIGARQDLWVEENAPPAIPNQPYEPCVILHVSNDFASFLRENYPNIAFEIIEE